MNKHELAKKITTLEGLTAEEKSALLQLLRAQKKYGLVWEDKPEEIETRLADELPVLEEVTSRALISDDPTAPNHILIEGDNLEALTALSYTHNGKIDVIYIDPPYNTGEKDFMYNDSYVDKEDSYYNSKWLSFMSKRLKVAKGLLKNDGIIFISIGDEEVSQLKLLCDDIFSCQCLGVLPRITKAGSKQGTYFRPTKDYVLVYCNNISLIKGFHTKEMQVKSYPLVDEDGRKYRKAHSLFQASLDPMRGCKNQRYYIEAPDGTLIIPPGKSMPFEKKDAAHVLPETRADNVWRWSYQAYLAKKDRIMFSVSKRSPLIDSFGKHTDWNVYEKKFEDEETEGEVEHNLPNDMLYDYMNSMATAYLNNMEIDFQFSKPWEMIAYLIDITEKDKNITVLDFFAGSGSTLDAIMQMNDGDGGHRIGILATNNENNICEDVTYPRNKKVIEGYVANKTKLQIPGLTHNNLRYYKTKLLPREQTTKNKHALMEAATELLCIKHNVYKERALFAGRKLNRSRARFFDDGTTKILIIYRREDVECFAALLSEMHVDGKIIVYVFSDNNNVPVDNFADVADKVELCALPAAIYDAYKKVLPKQAKADDQPLEDVETEETEETPMGETEHLNDGTQQLALNFNDEEEGGQQ